MIKNFRKLALTKQRKDALEIIEEGLKSINPFYIFREKLRLENDKLIISPSALRATGDRPNHSEKKFTINIAKFKNIFVIGFGKGTGEMASQLEKMLGEKINEGLIIDTKPKKLKRIKVKKGTHPLPSKKNLKLTKKILEIGKKAKKKDLVICLISGGGSSLFEKPTTSLENLIEINQKLLHEGANIEEINTLRKHLSGVKGGKLVQALSPASVISLIISDVPGNNLGVVASGPTFPDKTTINDALKIVSKYKIKINKKKLKETPKDEKLFKNVTNILFLTNLTPLAAMKNKAQKLGYRAKIITDTLKGEVSQIAREISLKIKKEKPKCCLLYGGETTLKIKGEGKGGRNCQLTLDILTNLPSSSLMISFASDGLDNSPACGAIGDSLTSQKAKKLNLKITEYLKNNDSYSFFEKTGDLIFTGPTGSNLADLIITLKN